MQSRLFPGRHIESVMPSLLYIHGFLSSPESLKAVQTGKWLHDHRPHTRYLCPFLTPYPDETRVTLETLVEQSGSPVHLIGSSLGGFWATWLAEKYDLRAVLVNPVVDLSLFRGQYLNCPLKNHHTEDTYVLREEHIAHFQAVDTPVIQRPENYLLMVQTGDEVLDYRLAVKKYAGCRQIVEAGGDHTYQHFEAHIVGAMTFLEQAH